MAVDIRLPLLQHPRMMRTRVLLGDGHLAFVEALAMRLDVEESLEVVAAVARPEEALLAVSQQPVDVAVLAVNGSAVNGSAPGFGGLGPRLQAALPGLKLIALADGGDAAALTRAVRDGFRGWVPKEVGVRALLEVIHSVCRGETCIPPLLLTRLLSYLLDQQKEQGELQRPFSSLTDREMQV